MLGWYLIMALIFSPCLIACITFSMGILRNKTLAWIYGVGCVLGIIEAIILPILVPH
jgi:hypothetical protein